MTGLRAILGLLVLLGFLGPAGAGSIAFDLERKGIRLQVTHRGDSIAYFPQALQLRADGHWQALPWTSGIDPPAQLRPGERIAAIVAEPAAGNPVAMALPVMLRFFDDAGSAAGQIHLLGQVQPATQTVAAGYRGNRLEIRPPPPEQAISASWLLWGQEEGVGALVGPIRFEHRQPPARRIECGKNDQPLSFFLGEGRPAALLLHETPAGLRLQYVASGGLRGREQRVFWLGQGRLFYGLALVFIAAFSLVLWAGKARQGKAE